MYGYVIVNKQEMKFKEFDIYHSYYCGLCTVLKEKYGFTGQFSISYDMTFLIMLLTGLYEPETTISERKCIAHPFEKHQLRMNEISDYVASMNILITYNKCMDDWIDEKKIIRRTYAASLSGKTKKIMKQYDRKCKVIVKALEDISDAENRNEENIDMIASYFGIIMQEIFTMRDDEWKEILGKMGYSLGKFIYLIDAYEDVDEDIKKDNYNPLKQYREREGFDEWCKQVLTMIMAECAKEFEKLPILQDVEILRNIVYSGVWTRFELAKNRRNKV